MEQPPTRTVVHVVPHTHWDREWYEPFEGFRRRLIRTFDGVLEQLDADPAYRFMADGQTAMIDDYLAVRPEREADVRRHAQAGRLDVGPWVALVDSLLISGETIVRNLQSGMRRAADFAPPMPVGHIPDAFGHTAQMPQILRLAGLDTATLWRGVPSAIDRTLFRWEALDGTEVLVGWLCASYSNGVALPADPDSMVERARSLVAEQQRFRPSGHVLALNGTDHWPPQAGLPALFDKANLLDDDVELRMSSMANWFEAITPGVDRTSLPVWRGELRSGWRANVLMGVTSCRVDLKGLQARAERELERYAEPLSVVAGYRPPAAWLDAAWRNVILNSAHDSVCSCSADETMSAVQVRYEEAARIAAGITSEAMSTLAHRIADDRVVDAERVAIVWNPSPFARSEVVDLEMTVPAGLDADTPLALESASGVRFGCVELSRADAVALELLMTGDQLASVIGMVRTREFEDVVINSVDVDDTGDTVAVTLHSDTRWIGHLDIDAMKARIVALAEADPARRFHIRLLRPRTVKLVARLAEVPGLGWDTLRLLAADGEQPTAAPVRVRDMHRIEWADGSAVEVAADGTWSMIEPDGTVRASGLGRLEDGGDAGDTYNYSPPPGADVVVTEPVSVETTVEESSPLRVRLRVRRVYEVPASLAADESARSSDTERLTVDMTLTATDTPGRLDVEVELDNRAKDHRLRMLLPAGERSSGSLADVAFGAVERGLDTEGGEQEAALPTWPAKRFAAVRGLALLCDQTLEYEVVDDGTVLAVTLLRATGYLSRAMPVLRPNPAGPTIPAEHAQSLGVQRISFGVALLDAGVDPDPALVADLAEAFAHPLLVHSASAGTGGDLPATGRAVTVDAPSGTMLQALVRTHGGVHCRVVPVADASVRVAVGEQASDALVDLRDEVVTPISPGEPAELRSMQIATFRCPT